MAQQYPCDICGEEPAAQMLTNTDNGTVMMLGINCLPVFYSQSLLTLLNAGDHEKIPSKCQACRRVHEQMIMAWSGGADTTPITPDEPALTGPEPE